MKKLVAALVVALAIVSNVQAEDTGNVENDSLAAIGLSELQTMTDSEGEQVRGSAASAFGIGFAFSSGPFGVAGELTGYGAFGFGNFAIGGNTATAVSGPFGWGTSASGSSFAGGF